MRLAISERLYKTFVKNTNLAVAADCDKQTDLVETLEISRQPLKGRYDIECSQTKHSPVVQTSDRIQYRLSLQR